MAATAKVIIKSAMRRLRVIQSGEEPSAAELADALEYLNDLLGTLSVEGLFVPHTTNETLNLTPGKQTYSIGSGGDFNTGRPISIVSAYTTINGVDYPCEVIPRKKWLGIVYKATSASYPYWLNYHDKSPLGEINFYPIPTDATTFTIDSIKQLTEFADANAVTDLPREYERYLKYALANELASEYGKTLTPMDALSLQRMTNKIKAHNHEPLDVKVFGSRRRYDIFTD